LIERVVREDVSRYDIGWTVRLAVAASDSQISVVLDPESAQTSLGVFRGCGKKSFVYVIILFKFN
jgi:hypothetical protein